MAVKQFKTESKRLLDMMANSIYTNTDIFLRELISNASDALDKRHILSLTDTSITADDLKIHIDVDKKNRTITISDNGIGMDKNELEDNLGTIARSGSFEFKKELDAKDEADIIGQFGVGFYSAFMVADNVEVLSRKVNMKSLPPKRMKKVQQLPYISSQTPRKRNMTTISIRMRSECW